MAKIKFTPLIKYMLASTTVFLVLICFLMRDNVIRWVRAGFTIGKQKRQIELYQQNIRELDQKIGSLSTDRDSLETFARENFLFAEPGDDVYLIEK